MKRFILCTALFLALIALLTTCALAFDAYNPPIPDAAEGWYGTAMEYHFIESDGTDHLSRSISHVNSFNIAGQLVKQVETIDDGTETIVTETNYQYDAQGRLIRSAEPNGNNELVYDYRDDGSILQTYTWWAEDETPGDARVNLYTYDPQAGWFWYGDWSFAWDEGGHITRRWNDTEEEVYTNKYDAQGRLVESVVKNTKDNTGYTDTYVYDSDGGYTKREQTSTGYEDFVYNAKGLLIRYVCAYEDPSIVLDYTYDEAGNCVKISGEQYRMEFSYEKGPTSFRDVLDHSSFYYDPVYWAVNRGITDGTSEHTFSPLSPCTRAQVVTFLWRAAGKPGSASGKNPFTDVKEGTYYYDAVLWAVEQGITTGTSEHAFSPNAICTRGQVVTFLWRNAGSPKTAAANPFTDVAESDYFHDAVLWAVDNGVTLGTSPDRFSPGSECQRAHVVTFLYRSLGPKG